MPINQIITSKKITILFIACTGNKNQTSFLYESGLLVYSLLPDQPIGLLGRITGLRFEPIQEKEVEEKGRAYIRRLVEHG